MPFTKIKKMILSGVSWIEYIGLQGFKMIIGPRTQGVLYHYTNHDSLYNIVETKSLRATHVYYMNDESEIKYAIERFIKIVTQRKEQTELANK